MKNNTLMTLVVDLENYTNRPFDYILYGYFWTILD